MNSVMGRRFLLLYALLAVTAVLVFGRQTSIAPTIEPLSLFPQSFNGWSMTSNAVFSDSVMAVLKPTDYLSRGYRDAGKRYVSLYIGYHDGSDSGAVHSPRLCLPGSGWNIVSEKTTTVSGDQWETPAVQSVYQKGSDKFLVLYWFRLAGLDLDNHYKLKLSELAYSFLHRRKDTALIRVETAIKGDEQEAIRTVKRFVASIYPLLVEHLPKSPP
jgi:EpsI family protein